MTDVTLMDGATGTSLWEKAEDKVPVWQYNMTNPQIVKELEEEFIAAGSELVQANTFGANRISMKNTPFNTPETVRRAMEILCEAAEGKIPAGSPAGKPAMKSLNIGPLAVLMEPYGDLTEDEVSGIFREMIEAALPYKPDFITFETFIDLSSLEVGVRAASDYGLPILCSMSFEAVGKTIFGNSPADMAETLKPYDAVRAIGLNCSLGPDKAVNVIRSFRESTGLPLIFKPNAGKPTVVDGKPQAQFDIGTFVKDSLPALDYGVKFIGGCCGTNPAYIESLRKALGRA